MPLNKLPECMDTDQRLTTAAVTDPKHTTIGLLALLFAVSAAAALMFAYTASSPRPSETQTAAAVDSTDLFSGLSLLAKAVIVIDIRTGTTLFELNADVQLPLASLTKVPLALAVSEVLHDDAIIEIPYDTAPAGSAERLAKGEKWKVRDILDFTLVASSNGGAEILAAAADAPLHVLYPDSPQSRTTLWRMNRFAETLGLTRTYFLNASGLDESTTQSGAYGSARDMARLFAYVASAQPSLFAGTARNGMVLTTANGQGHTSAINTNKAEGAIPGLILGKTGFTDLAGGNLAVVFDVGLGEPVVAVVLGSTQEGRFTDMQKLVKAARATLIPAP
jgi:D-alanyl-D-alanine carboxypeptidase